MSEKKKVARMKPWRAWTVASETDGECAILMVFDSERQAGDVRGRGERLVRVEVCELPKSCARVRELPRESR